MKYKVKEINLKKLKQYIESKSVKEEKTDIKQRDGIRRNI